MQDYFFIRENYIPYNPNISEKAYKALNSLFKGFIYLLPVLIYIYYKYKGKKYKEEIKTIEDIRRIEKKNFKRNLLMNILQFCLFTFFAIKIYWYYTPNND